MHLLPSFFHSYRNLERLAAFSLLFLLLAFSVLQLPFLLTNGASQQLPNVDSTWSYVGQNPENTWYSPQTMVNPANAPGLHEVWFAKFPHIVGSPVIVNGVVYVSSGGYDGNYDIYAINEQTGSLIWHDGEGSGIPQTISTTAGVAVADGEVFAGTADSGLVALNASTGSLIWKVPIADGIVGNPAGGYNGPQAIPMIYHREVIIANTEGDSGARGYIRAFNESNGNLLWTFYTVPPSPIDGSDQSFYHNTWGNCVECGGADIWNVPALDPNTGIMYFGTGNPSPNYNYTQRVTNPEDTNLFSNSVIALNVTNGQMVWYYQEVPADTHDWDQGMPVEVFTTAINNAWQRVVIAGGKDGYVYELDALTGALIHETEIGIHYNENALPTPSGVIVYPGAFGGVNSYYTYDPMTNMIYVVAYNQASNYTEGPIDFGNGQTEGSQDNLIPGYVANSTLYAIDASTGHIAWSIYYPNFSGGVSSSNNLLFTSDGDGTFYVLNAETGSTLWSYDPGTGQFDGQWTWGPASVTNGMVFETMFGDGGGVAAFTTNTSIVETSYPDALGYMYSTSNTYPVPHLPPRIETTASIETTLNATTNSTSTPPPSTFSTSTRGLVYSSGLVLIAAASLISVSFFFLRRRK